MSSSNKSSQSQQQQRRKEDGELSNDEDGQLDNNTSHKSSKKSEHSSRIGSSKERKSGKSSRRDNNDRDEKSHRNRHSSRSSSYHRSNTTQSSKSGRGKSREKRRDSRERSRERRRDSRSNSKRRERNRSNSHKRSNKGRRDSRSPRRGSKKEESRRRSRTPKNQRKDSPTSNNKTRQRSEEKKSPKQMTEIELKELEEANDKKYTAINDSDSDSDGYYYRKRNERGNGKHHTSKNRRSNSRDDISRNSKKVSFKKEEESSNRKNNQSNANKSKVESSKETSSNNQNYDASTLLLMENFEQQEDSEEEREKKKQELIDMIKGIKGKSEKNPPQPKQDANLVVEETQMEEEQGFDNDLINPDDAIDDEDDAGVADDYNGENDASIKQTLSGNKKNLAQYNYLKNLEDMRNRETKEGLEEGGNPGEDAIINTTIDAPTGKGAGIQSEAHSSFDWKETNKMHAYEEKEDSESEADMFGDDIEKFIGDDAKGKNGDGQMGVKIVNAECDDDQQYFKIRVGEILCGKYKILEKCGKGVFANVCKAEQLDNNKLVAIKILRSNDIMHESGQREKEHVQKLNLSDKNDKKHIVRLKNVFEHQKHICLVFECFAMNLRDALKQYAKGKGFSLDIVRSYAFQIFIALTHLKKNRMIHADLKPDNLLISEDTKTLKMCDFGTALSVEENGIIKYIQSRYYRAPEVLLGYPPYTQIDVWSIGVTLYEIYTQKYLFDGSSNNEMIKLIMDARGKFNKKMLQSGSFVNEYFDSNHIFQYIQVDPFTKQKYVTPIQYGDIPKNDLNKLLLANKEGAQFENQKKLAQFKDFLDKCLQLDPKNRLTPEDALRHPFLDTSVKTK